jgi:exopolyphosphatase/guanosine-5'-triphosphate,3'-diphosphate pyrophosphatase
MTGPPATFAGGDRVAVVEIGSGSVKLLITDEGTLLGGGPDPVRRSDKTQLLRGGGRDLDRGGLEATAQAFRRYAIDLADHGPVAVAAVATEAARRADDIEPLQRLSRDLLGAPLEVLSGGREAELGHAGAVAGRDLPGPVSLIDIGAGSTDFATPDPAADSIRGWSLPFGARDVVDGYLHRDPPGPDELSSALSVAELYYDDLRRELPQLVAALDEGTLVGVGALTQIAAVEIGLPDPSIPVDGYRLTKHAVEEVFRILATERAADRIHNPGLLPEHVDDIVGGLCLLVEFLRRFGVGELIVSERDLLHGRAAELLTKD